MGTESDDVLDECLARVRRGERPKSCLAAYPAQDAELGPLLDLAGRLWTLAPLQERPEAVEAGLQRMLAELSVHRERRQFSRSLGFWPGLGGSWRRLSWVLALLALIFFGGMGFTVATAAGSLPGDTLYPVKRAWEDVRLTLVTDEQAREILEQQLTRQRQQEIRSLVETGRQAEVTIRGVLERGPDGQWWIRGLPVEITANTRIEGAPVAGARATMRLQVGAGGTLQALELQTHGPALPALQLTATPTATSNPSIETPTPAQSATHAHTPEASVPPGDQVRPGRTPGAPEAPGHAPGTPQGRGPEHTPGTPQGRGPDNNFGPDHTPGTPQGRGPQHTPGTPQGRGPDNSPGPAHTPGIPQGRGPEEPKKNPAGGQDSRPAVRDAPDNPPSAGEQDNAKGKGGDPSKNKKKDKGK